LEGNPPHPAEHRPVVNFAFSSDTVTQSNANSRVYVSYWRGCISS
jgi:hypothetical protein